MANEIKISFRAGENLYFITQNQDGLFWNTLLEEFEEYNAAHWEDYATPMTAVGNSRVHQSPFPADIITAGLYRVDVRWRQDVSPGPIDKPLASRTVDWNGVSEQSLSNVTVSVLGQGGTVDWTYTVYKPGGSIPLPGTSVHVSIDISDAVKSFVEMSDSLGNVHFALDPGTYYVWRSHPYYTFDDPDVEVVS